MKKLNSNIYLIIVFVLTQFISSNILAENPDSTLSLLRKKLSTIKSAAEKFDVNWKTMAGVIYVERTNNVDWSDEALDNILAASGLNSSIGFCQVKMKTAYWIEVQLNDSLQTFYPGQKYSGILKLSESPTEIINKLNVDSLNIYYAAAYIKIIDDYWKKNDCSLDENQAVIATLYSTGMFKEGEARKPNTTPKLNWFGEEFLKSQQIIERLILK